MITLSALTYYPIKACKGVETEASPVERAGLAGDRRLMVVTQDGRFLTQREQPRLALIQPRFIEGRLLVTAPGAADLLLMVRDDGRARPVDIWRSKGVPAIDQGQEAADWFSTWLDHPVRLVHLARGHHRLIRERYAVHHDDHTGFADGYPILLAAEESLAELNARLEVPVPMDRFRPNLVVRGAAPFAEDGWSRVRIGGLELAVVKPCARCVVTTIDKETLARSVEPLRTLGSFRKSTGGVMFGQNAIPLAAGRLQVGMEIELLS